DGVVAARRRASDLRPGQRTVPDMSAGLIAIQVRGAVPPMRTVSFEKLVTRVADRFGEQAATAWTKTVLGHQARINEAQLRAAIASRNLGRIAQVVNAAGLASAAAKALQGPL